MSKHKEFWLLPEKPKQKGGMAHVIATIPGVQMRVDRETDARVLQGKRLLARHRVTGVAEIEKARGDVDGYVVLVDSNVTNEEGADNNSALSIEFGRAGYVDPETGDTYGQMEGLGILSALADKQKLDGKRIPKIKVRKTKRLKRSEEPR